MNNKNEKVLVTGASGYIALQCISDLLNSGYKVKGSLRDLNRERVTSDIKNWILEHKFENLVNRSKENIEKLKNYKFFHLLD